MEENKTLTDAINDMHRIARQLIEEYAESGNTKSRKLLIDIFGEKYFFSELIKASDDLYDEDRSRIAELLMN
jgi:hypothetical protein